MKPMPTLKKLTDLLTPSERKRAGLLMAMILIMAALYIIGVASIMPFIAVQARPQLAESNAVYTTLGFQDPQAFLIALEVMVFVLRGLAYGVRYMCAVCHSEQSEARQSTDSQLQLQRCNISCPF